MIRSFSNLARIGPGFRTDNVLTLRLSTPSRDYPDSPDVSRFYERLLQRVRALPGVEEAGPARVLPLATQIGNWGTRIEGYEPAPGETTSADWQVATAGYFEAMGGSPAGRPPLHERGPGGHRARRNRERSLREPPLVTRGPSQPFRSFFWRPLSSGASSPRCAPHKWIRWWRCGRTEPTGPDRRSESDRVPWAGPARDRHPETGARSRKNDGRKPRRHRAISTRKPVFWF